MSIQELRKILNAMYSKTPTGEQVAYIHLFGINTEI